MKTYNIGGIEYSLTQTPNNKQIFKFAKILGAKKFSDIATMFSSESQSEEKIFELFLDDSRLAEILSVVFGVNIPAEAVVNFDNVQLFSEILTDFFSLFGGKLNEPQNT